MDCGHTDRASKRRRIDDGSVRDSRASQQQFRRDVSATKESNGKQKFSTNRVGYEQDTGNTSPGGKRRKTGWQTEQQQQQQPQQQQREHEAARSLKQASRPSHTSGLLKLPSEILIKIADEVILADPNVQIGAALLMSPKTQCRTSSQSLYETCSYFHNMVPTRFAVLKRITPSGYTLLVCGLSLSGAATMPPCHLSIIGSGKTIIKEAKIPSGCSSFDKSIIMELKARPDSLPKRRQAVG